ncbi:tyrosine-type recombinase/integrase [Halobacterium noricense]|uniref:tyrosine-type recombinase/integrase n=1 Tax=Halobacterium noricense TaxID=223182 RepID=UPI00337D4444
MNDDLETTLKDCSVISNSQLADDRHIRIVPESPASKLTDQQFVDYHEYRKSFLSYLLNVGKNEDKAEGYSPYTVYADSYRQVRFDEWVWNQADQYKVPPTQKDASAYLEHIAFSDKSQTCKGKIQEALLRYSKWLQHKYGQNAWEFEWSFDGSGQSSAQPQDFLSVDERRKIRQAALNEGSIPARSGLTANERKEWAGYIAQLLDKPIDDVTTEDWDDIDGWKVTSIVWTSLDAGLRPVEVARARTSWVDTANDVLRIPRDESSKNEGNWTVSLTERTSTALDRWLTEREMYDRYDDTDALWLTYRGNPYSSQSLRRLLRRLCEDAGIEVENRSMSWYSIRHSVGTYMTKERDLAATKAQLRHKSAKTTMKYDQVPVEDRQDALDKMG